MRWYLNDASLQGQFADHEQFRSLLRGLLKLRYQNQQIRNNLQLTRMFPQAQVSPNADVRTIVSGEGNKDLKSALLNWFDRTGPFVDEDRLDEADDYFEFEGIEVTATGLGEATRRTKRNEECASFSFAGGAISFACTPLRVLHGLPEEPYGHYEVENRWELAELEAKFADAPQPVSNWQELVMSARSRFANLEIADLHDDVRLAREPFEASIANSAFELLAILDEYVSDRGVGGAEGPRAREIVELFFTGANARFSAESATNRQKFASKMTFTRRDGKDIVADCHGKIRHRFFRMHFEWPFDGARERLAVTYLGPKLTKA